MFLPSSFLLVGWLVHVVKVAATVVHVRFLSLRRHTPTLPASLRQAAAVLIMSDSNYINLSCSALSPLLFVIVMEAISTEFAIGLPWELLYADDLVVITEDESELITKRNQWKNCLRGKGLKVNVSRLRLW